jgi:hypothetical protein
MSPKRLPDTPLKRLTNTVGYVFTELQMKLLPGSSGYKSTTRGRELRCIQTQWVAKSQSLGRLGG